MNQPARDEAAWMPEKAKHGASRVAFFGGSFDPPHLGHLAVARAARAAFRLDTVLFAPVGVQPLKPEGSTASFEDRLAMTRLAVAGEPGFAVSLVDAPKSAVGLNATPNYTIDTLESLRAHFGADGVLYCLVGADSFLSLRRWHRAAEVPFAAPLIVASRPGEPLDGFEAALPGGLKLEPAPHEDWLGPDVEVRSFFIVNPAGGRAPFYVLPGLHVEISASAIRAELRGGPSHQAQAPATLPNAVAAYIHAHHLYL